MSDQSPDGAKTRYLSETEIRGLLRNSAGDARAINAMLIFSGLRVSELLGLTWQTSTSSSRRIRVRFQMSRKGKRSPSRPSQAVAT